jgi:hypothetical protein
VTELERWTTARDLCQDDGGELSCFSSHLERDVLADACDECWVGYTWDVLEDVLGDSKFQTKILEQYFENTKLISPFVI